MAISISMVVMVIYRFGRVLRPVLEQGINASGMSEFLVNFSGGFVRRGLLGECLYKLSEATGISPYPVILAGDFNDTPSSYTYREMKGALTDGFRRCGNGYGGTFRYLGGLLRIDYVFYDDTFECVRYYMPSEVVSDHKVVIAELRFK